MFRRIKSAIASPADIVGGVAYELGLKTSVETAHGGKLWADTYSELKTARNLALSQLELALIEVIPDQGIVFDIGAHIGIWTVPMALRRPKATIYAFEGATATHARLAKNVTANGIANADVHHLAVSDNVGSVTFQSPHNASVFGRIAAVGNSRGRYDNAVTVEVPCTTVADFCSRNRISHIDFIKIDVEGAELNVLRGALPLLAERKIEKIWMEVEPDNQKDFGSSVEALAGLIESVGYAAYRISAPNTPVNLVREHDNNMILKPLA